MTYIAYDKNTLMILAFITTDDIINPSEVFVNFNNYEVLTTNLTIPVNYSNYKVQIVDGEIVGFEESELM